MKPTIRNIQMFLKHIGEGRVDEARFLCSELGASVPLPRNETENIDLYDAFYSLGKFQTLKQIENSILSTVRIPLDGTTSQ